ncbi:hypothetical protein J7T55_000187 [Diaporthe amygdali]|uniref:uncharacterized protein n=1 Tax=Phomopsis amygdali TaxID=1214568 RepID=UPI0022FEBFBB|nr:uncharacterized protein J7T55_000187 [Diaporthe amygdali]KAJ0108222.1 hypothetical protein J7T55_000187 [Diaporthe amygdali]
MNSLPRSQKVYQYWGICHAFWKRQPVRLKVLCQDLYIVQGAKDVLGLFRQRSQSTLFVQRLVLENAFLLPKAATRLYLQDNSGPDAKPFAGSMVRHHNRVEFHARISQQRLLLGSGQSSLFRRLFSNITMRLSSLEIGQEWENVSDLLDVFKSNLTAATVDSLAGPALLQRHPSLVKDIWTIDKNIIGLLLKMPRFMNPKAHQARDRALEAVQDWQAWARQNFTPDAVDEEVNDPFWGSSFFRERQELFLAMDGFSYDAIASEDLSFIWSANTNAVVAAFWLSLEAFRDAELLKAVREEVNSCMQLGPDGQPLFDVPKLIRQPLLQAMFAENLRLRVHGFLVRRPREDMQINKWTIPRHHWCIASSTPASMDPDFWCTGNSSGHPVDQFWPGRFLQKDPESNALVFSLAGTEGNWVPFGGGAHACPGRILTKRANILALAVMVTLYDCEVLASDEELALNSGTYPFGSIPPRGNVPARIRRRAMI